MFNVLSIACILFLHTLSAIVLASLAYFISLYLSPLSGLGSNLSPISSFISSFLRSLSPVKPNVLQNLTHAA
jgi:hypothetical protein